MSHNPYVAPAVPVEVPPQALPAMRKPISVWVTQILAGVLTLSPMRSIYLHVRAMPGLGRAGGALLPTLLVLGFALLMLGVLILMIVQLQRRSAVGRWLAVALIVLMAVAGKGAFIGAHGNLANQIGYITGLVMVYGALLWWLYQIGFSRKVRAWFTKTDRVPDPSAPG